MIPLPGFSNIPTGFRLVRHEPDGFGEQKHFVTETGLSVIVGTEVHDGRPWLHVSLARRDRLPAWADVVLAKEVFVGIEANAIMPFPPRSEWVNKHRYCLHLWAPMGWRLLPDFRRPDGLI